MKLILSSLLSLPVLLSASLMPALLVAGEAKATAEADQEINSQAKLNYMINCQGCHRGDGSGLAGSVPTFVDFVGKFLSVEGGREFLVQVPGSANSPLDDRELAELLNWILVTMSPAEVEEDFAPYTESEVSFLRGDLLVEVDTTRAALVEKFN